MTEAKPPAELSSILTQVQTLQEEREKLARELEDTRARMSKLQEGKREEMKKALDTVIAKWLASGVLEYVEWNDRVPVLLQPCGAVPKGTAPFYRLITDARRANTIYADWGVTYTTAAQLSSTLNR